MEQIKYYINTLYCRYVIDDAGRREAEMRQRQAQAQAQAANDAACLACLTMLCCCCLAAN